MRNPIVIMVVAIIVLVLIESFIGAIVALAFAILMVAGAVWLIRSAFGLNRRHSHRR